MAGKSCFVIGPIGSDESEFRVHADWLYHGIIVPAFDEHFKEFQVERADKIATPGMVSSQIINRLHDAELVIADMSFHNANAFYEMSIRHKVGKPIIHMIRKGELIPFDVIPHRAIPFSTATFDDLVKAKMLLVPAIRASLEPGFDPDNPITHARGRLELEKTASSAERVMMTRLEATESRLAALETASNALAGVVSHQYVVQVQTIEPGPQAYDELVRSVRLAIPGADIKILGADQYEVTFRSTKQGAQRTFKRFQDMSVVLHATILNTDIFN
jgi:hypothetical protein